MNTRASLLVIPLLAAGRVFGADNLPEDQKQGQALVNQLLAQHPTQNYTNTGVLHIRDGSGKNTDIPLTCELSVTATNWSMAYHAAAGTGEDLVIVHADGQPNQYHFHAQNGKAVTLAGDKTMASLAGSDFWIADLGQEFLHWPVQKLLRKEVKRSQGCSVLESTNPQSTGHGYARVVSWIDTENQGFVQAFAYDDDDQLIKEFYPKDVKKVNGQWQVGMMEMNSDRTGSRTRLEFNLEGGGSPKK